VSFVGDGVVTISSTPQACVAERGHHLLLAKGASEPVTEILEVKFPRFVFHDGAFESLDDRKKENLLAILHQYADLGIQSVITLIDSDLPKRGKDGPAVFDADEIVSYTA